MLEYILIKVSVKSTRMCKAPLWRVQHYGKEAKQVPITTFNTQKFELWLNWFLSRMSIEDYLEKSFNKTSPEEDEVMNDLQDSPRWNNLKSYRTSKYHLIFGMYIDWFNPLTNKIAGW